MVTQLGLTISPPYTPLAQQHPLAAHHGLQAPQYTFQTILCCYWEHWEQLLCLMTSRGRHLQWSAFVTMI